MTGKLALLGALAALTLAPEASAKMCVKITTVPARPVAGAPTTIRVTTWLPVRDGGGEYWAGDRRLPVSANAQINVRVTPPGGQPQLLRVRRRADKPSVFEGRFTFPRRGLWTLAWAAFPNYSACGGAMRVPVT